MMLLKDIFLAFVVLAACSSICSSAADSNQSYGPLDGVDDVVVRRGRQRELKKTDKKKTEKSEGVPPGTAPPAPAKSNKSSKSMKSMKADSPKDGKKSKKKSKTSTPVTMSPTPAPLFVVVAVYDAECTAGEPDCDAAAVAAANELAFIDELCAAGINANGVCPSGGGRDDTVVEVTVSAADKSCTPVDTSKNCFDVAVQSASTSSSAAVASTAAGDQAVANGSIQEKVSVDIPGYEATAPDVTLSPTENPSPAPTTSPTQAPTNPPTTSPTESPTASPTPEPTEGATDEPSEVPSEAPSVTAPTPATPPPVATPSPTDSQYPSKDPTGMPTESFKPTA